MILTVEPMCEHHMLKEFQTFFSVIEIYCFPNILSHTDNHREYNDICTNRVQDIGVALYLRMSHNIPANRLCKYNECQCCQCSVLSLLNHSTATVQR